MTNKMIDIKKKNQHPAKSLIHRKKKKWFSLDLSQRVQIKKKGGGKVFKQSKKTRQS